MYKLLQKERLISIATYGKKPWIASVFYVADKNLNLYFFSSPNTQHCQDIAINPAVACSIADTSQTVSGKKLGIQIIGKAKIEGSVKNPKMMMALWHKINPGREKVLNIANMKNKVIEAKFYKISPEKIKIFKQTKA